MKLLWQDGINGLEIFPRKVDVKGGYRTRYCWYREEKYQWASVNDGKPFTCKRFLGYTFKHRIRLEIGLCGNMFDEGKHIWVFNTKRIKYEGWLHYVLNWLLK